MKLGDFHQLQDKDFIVESVIKSFMQIWSNGRQAKVSLECKDGGAFMNFSVSLGTGEKKYSVPPSPVPPSPRKSRTRSSPSKLRRNRARAQDYFERKKLEKVPSLSKTDPDSCLFISEDFESEESVKTGVSDTKSASAKVSDYQLCFIDDDVFDERTETKIAVDNNKAEFGFGVTDKETSEISSLSVTSCGDQCAVGPTVHCHHTDESASDERMIMFEEMAGGGGCGQEEPFITEWDISYVYNLAQSSAFDDGCLCRNWSYHDYEKYYVKTCPDCGVAPFLEEWEKYYRGVEFLCVS